MQNNKDENFFSKKEPEYKLSQSINETEDEKFKNILEYILKPEQNIEENIEKLKDFYKDDKRHSYAIISEYSFSKEVEELNVLAENIRGIYRYSLENKQEIAPKIYKLFDHINLEIVRKQSFEKFKQKTKELANSTKEEVMEEIKEAKKLAESAKQETQSMTKNYITILGIFSSVILAFVAGLTFTNSVLANIDKASIYRLCFIVCLIGLFITNILYYLFDFIRDINRKKLEHTKNTFFSCSNPITRFNIAIFVIMVLIGLVWFFKDEKTSKNNSSNGSIKVSIEDKQLSNNRTN